MNAFEKRPLALLSAVFFFASALIFTLSSSAKLSLLIASLMALALVFVASHIPAFGISAAFSPVKGVIFITLAALTASSALSYFAVNRRYDALSDKIGTSVSLSGYVTDITYESSYGGYYTVKITELDGEDVSFGALLELEFSAGLEVGDVFAAAALVDELDSDGAFDERSYYSGRGVIVSLLCDDTDSLEVIETREGISRTISALRYKISAILSVMAERAGGVSGADGIPEVLFVGDRSNLDEAAYRDFKYIGASHLLAISGLHFSVLIGGLESILKRTFLGRRTRAVLLIAASLFYMTLTGFSSSVLRAGIMMIIYSLSYFFRREPDRITSLFVSGALIVAVSPYSAADTGLLLSVTAMTGCIFSGELFMSGRVGRFLSRMGTSKGAARMLSRAVKYVYGSLAVSVSALIFTLPVMWIKLGEISVISPLSTLLLSIPVTIILYLCPLVVLTFGFCPPVSAALSYLIVIFARFAVSAASLLSNIPNASILLPSGNYIFLLIPAVVGVLLAAAFFCRKGHGIYYVSAALACFVVFTSAIVSVRALCADPSVTYINSGTNDGFAVTDGDVTMIVDISDGSWSVASSAVSALADNGYSRVNVYMITHLHTRYARTLKRLVTREYVDCVWIPAPETEDEMSIYDKIINTAGTCGVPVVTYSRGDILYFGGITIDTAVYTKISRSTHPIIALSIKTEDGLTAYIGSSVHESELYEYALDMAAAADTVIFGTHGPVYKSGAVYTTSADIIFASTDVSELILGENSYESFELYGYGGG
ncbi:MAG: ComEC/Rec2 family competence protein [Firmicutes bacterium]|nr:ComEC/Rec2 family competence protein [Bacillota bacterium]